MLISVYYTFSIKYPTLLSAILIFLQHSVFNIPKKTTNFSNIFKSFFNETTIWNNNLYINLIMIVYFAFLFCFYDVVVFGLLMIIVIIIDYMTSICQQILEQVLLFCIIDPECCIS